MSTGDTKTAEPAGNEAAEDGTRRLRAVMLGGALSFLIAIGWTLNRSGYHAGRDEQRLRDQCLRKTSSAYSVCLEEYYRCPCLCDEKKPTSECDLLNAGSTP